MADSNVAITAGSGTTIDTQVPSDGTDHRQVVVLGSPTTNARVAEVDANGRLTVAQGGASVTSTAATSFTATGTYSTSVISAGNATVYLYPTTAANTVTAGVVVVFEQSFDNNQWGPLLVTRSDTGVAATTFTLPAVSSTTILGFNVALLGINYLRARITTFAGTNALSIVADLGGGQFTPLVSVAGSPAVTLAAGTSAVGTVILGAGSAAVGTVTAPAVTKSTQGTTGFTTQDLKDAGRLVVTFSGTAVAGVTTEAFIAGTLQKGATTTGVTAGTVSGAVTSGKVFRITAMDFSLRSGAAAVAWTRFVLRTSFTATAATATSPLLVQIELITASATTGVGDRIHLDFPDGIELASTVSWGLTRLSSATTNVETFSITGFEY